MKIELKKLNALQHAVLPFSEVIDLKDEKMYGRKPFQSPSIKTVYSTECARCLKPLDIPLEAEADMILSDDPEAEEEDDLFVLTGDSVDPADVLVPALILQVQMTYLCKEDCKGLCPHCGADRNVTECDCESRQIDPRFAALRALLDNDKGN